MLEPLNHTQPADSAGNDARQPRSGNLPNRAEDAASALAILHGLSICLALGIGGLLAERCIVQFARIRKERQALMQETAKPSERTSAVNPIE